MSNEYESALIKLFGQLDLNNFTVDLSEQFLFLCGGKVDAKLTVPPSLRDRLFSYTITNASQIHDSFVLAEEFKDYFKDNIYSDLLEFEDDIANISTLVIILLESPGSLVELGMFCTKPSVYKKLLIVAPQDETQDEDSFIYLGPLEYIKKKSPSSIAVYPWSDPDVTEYDQAHLSDLCDVIQDKLDSLPKSEKFKINNSGHVALLIYEIVALSYPILVGDIELSLEAMGIDLSSKVISKHLYLLSKLKLIDQLLYSSYRYYYPISDNRKKILFGKTKKNKILDAPKIKMSIAESYVLSDNSLAKKRMYARKQILKIHKEKSQ